MYEDLKIAALPIDISLGDIDANMQFVELAAYRLDKDTDVMVLPELFSTGYIADKARAEALAEPSDGPVMKRISQIAKKHSCAICGSFLAKDSGNLYNRAFFAEPAGDIAFYDKRHLFNISEESKIVTPGSKLPPVVRFRGWNIAMAICYDLRFPVWLRNVGLKYDALLLPSNWPEKRAFAFTHLLQARAIENQAYLVGANRAGADDFGHYEDQTHIYDYMGKPIGEKRGAFVTATLDLAHLRKFREAFPVSADADNFTIQI